MTTRTALMALLVTLGGAWFTRADAQAIAYGKGQKPAADKIIAIVGDKIILLSDLQNTLVNQQKQYPNLPANADCMVLEQMMSQNVLTLQAEKDSLPVSDDEVEQQLEHRVRYFESLYGSQQKMEQVLGMSIYQIKDKYRKDIKDIMLAQAEQKKIVDAVKITPTEVEQFFKSIPTDSLPFFKSEVEVGQIVINPKPTPDVVEYIKNQLRGMREEALSGKRSFQTLANLYSKDLATGGKILTVDRRDIPGVQEPVRLSHRADGLPGRQHRQGAPYPAHPPDHADRHRPGHRQARHHPDQYPGRQVYLRGSGLAVQRRRQHPDGYQEHGRHVHHAGRFHLHERR
jgi:hypothetical protein